MVSKENITQAFLLPVLSITAPCYISEILNGSVILTRNWNKQFYSSKKWNIIKKKKKEFGAFFFCCSQINHCTTRCSVRGCSRQHFWKATHGSKQNPACTQASSKCCLSPSGGCSATHSPCLVWSPAWHSFSRWSEYVGLGILTLKAKTWDYCSNKKEKRA